MHLNKQQLINEHRKWAPYRWNEKHDGEQGRELESDHAPFYQSESSQSLTGGKRSRFLFLKTEF